jgi:GNAT superfamily N-acetyltransferase
MAEIDRFRLADRRAIDALYRRVFGHDAADANRFRWDWQYARNPNNPSGIPEIWIAREGPTIVGQYATMPVRLWVKGQEVYASWGMDVMVAPERQRQGLGEVLFRTWDQNVGAALGLGLSESSYRLFKKLKWPDVGPLPCLWRSIAWCRRSRFPWC